MGKVLLIDKRQNQELSLLEGALHPIYALEVLILDVMEYTNYRSIHKEGIAKVRSY